MRTRATCACISVIAYLIWKAVFGSEILKSYMLAEEDIAIAPSTSTFDMQAESEIHCALLCLKNKACCGASYFSDYNCRLDTSLNCGLSTFYNVGVKTCRKQLNSTSCQFNTSTVCSSVKSTDITSLSQVTDDSTSVDISMPIGDTNEDTTTITVAEGTQAALSSITPYPCIACLTYGTSMYEFYNGGALPMEDARLSCLSLGGKLPEVETQGESDFLKEAFSNKGGIRYWIGSHYEGSYHAWLTRPNEPMNFTDWHFTQPDAIDTDFCVAASVFFDFRWGSWHCSNSETFVCEFD